MNDFPTDSEFDSTLALYRDGYEFISRGCERHASPVFQTRLLLEPTICMSSEIGARIFYDRERFVREAAAPARIQKTLFGVGGVQGLDGRAHRERKAMLLSILTPEAIGDLIRCTERIWFKELELWEREGRVVLFDAVQRVLMYATCDWLGIPLAVNERESRLRDIASMIDGAGGLGARYLRARLARERAERWLSELVRTVRNGPVSVTGAKPVEVIARHRNAEGETRLAERVAAVEILNLLRPTVAVARFVTFAAHALHTHPECAERVGDAEYLAWFCEEVRRFYPFFPFTAARVRASFVWNDFLFLEGRRTLLDLYGINHDPRSWKQPNLFDPERFSGRAANSFQPIPQGGGDYLDGHRCAGEQLTERLIKLFTRLFVASIEYSVPPQDLSLSLSRIPAMFGSRFVIENVQRKRHGGAARTAEQATLRSARHPTTGAPREVVTAREDGLGADGRAALGRSRS